VRLPTVSAQQRGIDEPARFVLDRAGRAGFAASAERVADGPPTIIGEQGAGARTLLVYDHYDVQPPDPLAEWTTPPFEPTVRDGKLFARGSAADKGQVFCLLKAIAATGRPPVNLRLLIAGEEEHGIRVLFEPLRRQLERTRAD